MSNRTKTLLIFLLLILAVLSFNAIAQAKEAVVRAVLFFSPTCGHCQKVITQDLPPLAQQYGDQLQIVGINVTLPEGQEIYQNAITYFQIPEENIGVPMLVVANTVLFGSVEIPEKFPGLIENGLAGGGIPWPKIPGLEAAIAQVDTLDDDLSMFQRFQIDPVGNSISVVVLFGMLASLIVIGLQITRQPAESLWKWTIPVLSILGMLVAGYLSVVELSKTEAVCGPVGDCNAVQQSEYARLFGVFPVGILGLAGYVAILAGWAIQQYGPENLKRPAALAVWGMALFGVIFSIYLTFLEPFVIGATCAWCITSAILITLQLWFATPALKQAIFKGDGGQKDEESLFPA